MTPDDVVEPVSVYDAADRLKRAPATIHLWALRYNARRVGKQGRRVYFDLRDLRVIEREIMHEHPIPATWEERAATRLACPLRDAERACHAA